MSINDRIAYNVIIMLHIYYIIIFVIYKYIFLNFLL